MKKFYVFGKKLATGRQDVMGVFDTKADALCHMQWCYDSDLSMHRLGYMHYTVEEVDMEQVCADALRRYDESLRKSLREVTA